MKIVFFGTPEYVIPILDGLNRAFKTSKDKSAITAVVTQKPKPAGRRQTLIYSPVDTWAFKKKIPIFFESTDLIGKKIQADLGIVASYGAIIPKKVIGNFPHGILNVHPSLLPNFRGSSPVQATIITGDRAGVTFIKLDEKLDHGPIVSQFKEDILPEDSAETLRGRLFARSAEVLATLIPAYLSGKITPKPQDHSKATFTREIKKEHAFVPPKFLNASLSGQTLKDNWEIGFIKDFTINPSPSTIHNFIRAMRPWPISWTLVQLSAKNKEQSAKRLKILKAHLEPAQSTNYKLQATKLVLDEVQLEGKTRVSWKQFLEGYREAKFA